MAPPQTTPLEEIMSEQTALETAALLLKTGEQAVPEHVRYTIRFLSNLGTVWFQLSRNSKATSCTDAANKRYRLGATGIDLHDELRSSLLSYKDAGNVEHFVLVHCRSDRQVDYTKLRKVLQCKRNPKRVNRSQVHALGLSYGTINPFETWKVSHPELVIRQIFDIELLETLGVPGTMMTNAGDRTWGIEFYAHELIKALPEATVADITKVDPRAPVRKGQGTVVGIITGNGPESGMLLWNLINSSVREMLEDKCRGDASMPSVRICSLPVLGLTMELDSRTGFIWNALERAIRELCKNGVTILTLACHTTHYYTRQIRTVCAEYDVTFLSMPEVLLAHLESNGITDVALVGIKYVAELDQKWSAYTDALSNRTVEVPNRRALERIGKIAYAVKTDGATREHLSDLRDALKTVQASHVIIALTELSLLLATQKKSKRYKILIDPLQLYAEAVARLFLAT